MDATGERADDERRIAELLAAIQASSDAVYVADDDGRITSWNRSAERIYGYASDAVGRHVTMLVPAHRVDDPAVFARVLHGERIERHETEQRRRDGSLVPVWLTVLPVRDLDGRVVGASFAARDVAELETAQATLADAEGRLRDGEALAHIGGWAWDVDTDTVQWSDELFRIHGISPLDFEGTFEAHLAGVAPDQREDVRGSLQAAVAHGTDYWKEYEVRRPDGELRQIRAIAKPVMDAGGRVTGLRGVRIDMTERRQAEAALQAAVDRERAAAEELRAADRLKDDFLSTVSHELRTPLTSIVGFASLLDAGEPTDETTRRLLVQRIGTNAVQMHNMIEGLLDFSRLQAGRVELHLLPVALADHVRACVTALAAVVADHVVTLEIPEDLVVQADPTGLDRVLTNLLTNASKFGPPGTTIEVGAARRALVPRNASVNGSEVEVWVRDQGPGIAPADQDRIFERFVQLAPSDSGRRGAGVGLAVVQQYVELHGGKVWCEGERGTGTTFRFTLQA